MKNLYIFFLFGVITVCVVADVNITNNYTEPSTEFKLSDITDTTCKCGENSTGFWRTYGKRKQKKRQKRMANGVLLG